MVHLCAVPAVTNVNPNTGPPSGGTSVTITGTKGSRRDCGQFRQQRGWLFHHQQRNPNDRDRTSWYRDRDVTVTTAAGTSATSWRIGSPMRRCRPSLTSIQIPVRRRGHQRNHHRHQFFRAATAVRFGSNAAGSFTINSATQMTGPHQLGSGPAHLTVTTAAGTSATIWRIGSPMRRCRPSLTSNANTGPP